MRWISKRTGIDVGRNWKLNITDNWKKSSVYELDWIYYETKKYFKTKWDVQDFG